MLENISEFQTYVNISQKLLLNKGTHKKNVCHKTPHNRQLDKQKFPSKCKQTQEKQDACCVIKA